MSTPRLQRWLERRWAPAVIVLLAVVLAAPALGGDFTADDHLHRLLARSEPGLPGLRARPLDLFVFAGGDPADTAALRDVGVFPWWTDLDVRLAFWRPLSSLTHAADAALWPDAPAPMLAHNLAWMALSSLLVWLLYRRFVPTRWIAVLALALDALDDARGPVVAWIANRNALVALAAAVPVLLVHDRWRRDGWVTGRWLGPVLLLLALGAGESALAIGAYLVAHALWLDRAAWPARARALAPYLVVVVAWRVVYGLLGYGAAGSGIYLDPGSDPLGFAAVALTRVPALLLGQLALPWSELAAMYPLLGGGVVVVMAVVALVVVGAIGLCCAGLLRRDPVSRFFATGMVLAVLPVAATFPADRLLGFVGLGGAGLMAQLLAAALTDRPALAARPGWRRVIVGAAAVLAVVHLVLAPLLLPVRARSIVTLGAVLDRADAGVPAGPEVAAQTVILANPPLDAFAGYLPVMRASRGQARPAHLYWLANATSAVTLTGVDAHTLRVAPAGGFLRLQADQMLRRADPRVPVGERVARSGRTPALEALPTAGRPATVLARFAAPLDAPSLVWRRWDQTTFAPFVPPAPGQSVTLPAANLFEVMAR